MPRPALTAAWQQSGCDRAAPVARHSGRRDRAAARPGRPARIRWTAAARRGRPTVSPPPRMPWPGSPAQAPRPVRARRACRPAGGPDTRGARSVGWPAPPDRSPASRSRNNRGHRPRWRSPAAPPHDDRLPGNGAAEGTFLPTSSREDGAWMHSGWRRPGISDDQGLRP